MLKRIFGLVPCILLLLTITAVAAAGFDPPPGAMMAAAPAAGGSTAIDLTQIIIAVVGGVFTILATVLAVVVPLVVNKYVKDKQAAVVVSNAITNALGKIQQAGQAYAEGEIQQLHPHLNVPDYLAPGVQYVLDHAGEEASRFGLTPESIADKIVAQIGLKNMETNLAITQGATPVTNRMGVTAPVVAGPMAPVKQALHVVLDPEPLKPEEPSSESGGSIKS